MLLNHLRALIPARSSHCHKGKERFERGDDYTTVLREDEDGVWRREDYCRSCCSETQRGPGISWEGKIASKEHKERVVDKRAIALLRRLWQADDRNLLYPLALYLQRKGELVQRRELTTYKQCGFELLSTGEIFIIEKSALSPKNLPELLALLEKYE